MLQLLTANLSGKVRRETLDGREYLVAPLSMIVPGVLNGSKGPLFYPLEEISRNADAWNGMPIVINHPTDESGNAISGRSPRVIEKFGVGTVYNATVSDKLAAEGWFEVEKTRRLSPTTYDKLLQGEPEELSTGLYTDNIPVKNKDEAVYNGKSYIAIACNYKPDHLAILPGKRGACSVADGCGVNVNEEVGVDNAFCPTGKGGGVNPTCSGVGGTGRHSIKLPKNKKKLTIGQVDAALSQMGFVLGEGRTDLLKGKATYQLTEPGGSKTDATIEEIRDIVYRGANNAAGLEVDEFTDEDLVHHVDWDGEDGVVNQLSHSDLRHQLSKLIRERYGVNTDLVDVFDKSVVYTVFSEGNGAISNRYYQISYGSDLRTGKVSLSDQGSREVVRKTEYKPVSNVDIAEQILSETNTAQPIQGGTEDKTHSSDRLEGQTGETREHIHRANVDANGYGYTSYDQGHSHRVEAFEVLPPDYPESDEHVHALEQSALVITSVLYNHCGCGPQCECELCRELHPPGSELKVVIAKQIFPEANNEDTKWGKDGCSQSGGGVKKRWWELVSNETVTKKEGDETLTAADYAYVPDSKKPSTWKLRIDDARHVGGAIAAIGKGFRGQKADIPSADLLAVKKKIRAAWFKHNPDKEEGDLPVILRNEWYELVSNAFCPTGSGGGIDPTCSGGSGGSKGSGRSVSQIQRERNSIITGQSSGDLSKLDKELNEAVSARISDLGMKDIREQSGSKKVKEVANAKSVYLQGSDRVVTEVARLSKGGSNFGGFEESGKPTRFTASAVSGVLVKPRILKNRSGLLGNGEVTPSKARKILKDGMIRGKKLTEEQRKFFGAIASKDKQTTNKETTMPLTAEQKEKIIEDLINNEGLNDDAPQAWNEDDREALNALPDAKLVAFNQQRELLVNAMHDEEMEEMEEMPKKKKDRTSNEVQTVTANSKPKTAQEWLDEAPSEIRSVVNNALAFEKRQRQDLIDKVIGNERNAFSKEYLGSRSLEELQGLARLAVNEEKQSSSVLMPHYAGVPGIPMVANVQPNTEDDLEMVPDYIE